MTYQHKQISVDSMMDFRRRNISWRKYGLHGELKRPIHHRFDIKGGDTMFDVLRWQQKEANRRFCEEVNAAVFAASFRDFLGEAGK